MANLTVIVPVYNDWVSFVQLLRHLSETFSGAETRLRILAVDDGSSERMPQDFFGAGVLDEVESLEVLRLALNMGHQRALAIGVCAALEGGTTGHLVIMDADGEDRPMDVKDLLRKAEEEPGTIVVAQRAKRSEKLGFRVFYQVYKGLFRLLTGKVINFGNFSLFSPEQGEQLTMMPELWNNLPAAVLRSRIRLSAVPIHRGRRYAGSSKMNFASLALHGISAYSVYTDAIVVRLLIATIGFTAFAVVVSVVVVVLRLFTAHATPGWATSVVFGLAIIATQGVFTTLMAALLTLSARGQKTIVPAREYLQYIKMRIAVPYLSRTTEAASASRVSRVA